MYIIIHVLGNVYAHTCTVCMHIHGYTCYTVYVCVSCSMLYVVLEAPTSPTSHHKSDSGDHSGNDSGSGSSHSGSSSTVVALLVTLLVLVVAAIVLGFVVYKKDRR